MGAIFSDISKGSFNSYIHIFLIFSIFIIYFFINFKSKKYKIKVQYIVMMLLYNLI